MANVNERTPDEETGARLWDHFWDRDFRGRDDGIDWKAEVLTWQEGRIPALLGVCPRRFLQGFLAAAAAEPRIQVEPVAAGLDISDDGTAREGNVIAIEVRPAKAISRAEEDRLRAARAS